MKQDKINTECNFIYWEIEKLQDRLTQLRSKCKHNNTFQGYCSYMIGRATKAIICTDCGKVLIPNWQVIPDKTKMKIKKIKR